MRFYRRRCGLQTISFARCFSHYIAAVRRAKTVVYRMFTCGRAYKWTDAHTGPQDAPGRAQVRVDDSQHVAGRACARRDRSELELHARQRRESVHGKGWLGGVRRVDLVARIARFRIRRLAPFIAVRALAAASCQRTSCPACRATGSSVPIRSRIACVSWRRTTRGTSQS